jgi:hypothetical protein
MLQVQAVTRIASLYILWIFLHYASAHVYTELCVPPTVKGFLLSPFVIATPHCSAMRWLMQNGANSINAAWLILGAAVIKYIAPIQK